MKLLVLFTLHSPWNMCQPHSWASMSDDEDIQREINALFTRTNMLCRRFKICSLKVKLKLFRSHCICLYDAALWSSFTVTMYKKLSSCHYKCMKSFFGYCKYSSLTSMLFELGLPSFNTLMHNSKFSFECNLLRCSNMLVSSMSSSQLTGWQVNSHYSSWYHQSSSSRLFYWLFCCFCVSMCLCVSVFSYGPMCLRQIRKK